MKSYLLISLKLLLLTLATLSQSSIAHSREPYGKGLTYIEKLPEPQDVVKEELKKQEATLKQLELAEKSAGKPLLSYGSSSEVTNSKNFDYVGECVPANGNGEDESVSCREKLLGKMCETQLMLETANNNTTNFCQQYFDLATSYSQDDICVVWPFHIEHYQHLDNNSLKKLLLACQQALLEKISQPPRRYYSTAGFMLRNLKEIYFALKDYSGAKDFFTDIIKVAKKKDKQANRESSKDISWNTKNIIYPALNILGDIYFATEDWDKAMNLYLEANSIYTKHNNDHQTGRVYSFLAGGLATLPGGSLSPASIARTYSFVGNRSRLALIMAMKGQTNDAKKLLDDSIKDLEKVSKEQVDKADVIALQEIGTPLYTTQQLLLTNDKEYGKALEYADRSRSLSYIFSLEGLSRDIPDVLSFQEMQVFAKDQKATLVLYSIPDLPIYDYDKFQARENKVLIWVIQPNGKLNFREVDVSSVLNQSNSSSEFNNIKSTRFVYGAVNSTIFIYGAIVLVSIGAFTILSPNHRRIGVAALIGISSGLVLTNTFNSLTKIELKDRETTGQTVALSNLTKDTLLAIKNRDSNQTSLLKKLYQVLIEPIQNTLPTNPDEHIVFIPYRGLHRVPFASLISSDNKYLIDQHTIRIAPSIQALKFITERAASAKRVGNDYLIVGNPKMSEVSIGSLGVIKVPAQLPSAEVEAREIAKLYGTTPLIGRDASIERVQSKLFNSRILHFATHGFLNIGDSRAGLVMTSGVLDTRDLYSNRFMAEMAVLSACNTGLGTETVEGNLGLTRPFLIGGVPTVVSSLWSVPDRSTRELMIDFYQNLKNTSDQAKALRQAMLNAKGKRSDPVDWSAFTLTGLGESPKASASRSVKQVVGYLSCGRSYARGGGVGENSRDLLSATLESTPNGFTLALTEADGSKHKLNLDDQNLVLLSASSFSEERNMWGPWNLVANSNSPFEIKSDGSFDTIVVVSTRSVCKFVGKVEFIGDAADKLARTQR
ncbi:CHAT domain-containing protein [Okeania sp. SIO2B3]|uniref:CHAT domain-containing protein n=1 Tax=Okeania sp. SIO2B3 TaxID=2607784 RepID=UPI0013BF5C2D|nr:CHAT domain-containing protein [Okeania sp. SIO2B3]NET45607.1 CHAT domain-containing protein [Okeania sp. SIO2B3]